MTETVEVHGLEALEVEVQWMLNRKAEAIEALTQMDREWAEMVAGRTVTDAEAYELKRDYEAWASEMEKVFG